MLLSSHHNTLFFGIDGGGSKCKAVLMDENNTVLGNGISGPANPLYGFEQATDAIVESACLALQAAGLSSIPLKEINAGIGLAGVNLPVLFAQMQTWQHPFKQMFLAHDLVIACYGAHQNSNGAVIITGTGSCGFSSVEGEETLIGGHGFPQGDIGSGAWFGLQAVKQVLLVLDGLAARSLMTDLLLAKLACTSSTEIVSLIADKPPSSYAQLAHIVFTAAEQGDVCALAIVDEGATYINHLAQRLLAKHKCRLALLGGLSTTLKPWLAKDVQGQLSAPLNPPEVGAVYFLKAMLAKQHRSVNNQ